MLNLSFTFTFCARVGPGKCTNTARCVSCVYKGDPGVPVHDVFEDLQSRRVNKDIAAVVVVLFNDFLYVHFSTINSFVVLTGRVRHLYYLWCVLQLVIYPRN